MKAFRLASQEKLFPGDLSIVLDPRTQGVVPKDSVKSAQCDH